MIVATNNKGKLKEFKDILKDYELYSLKEKGINIDILEDEDTFLGNAKKKALKIYEIAHEAVISDDSGLCVSCLNGFPGVMTHRFLGSNATDKERNEYIIQEASIHNDRSAQVICNIVYYDGEHLLVGEGILDGFISDSPRGVNGFGFDSIFELPNGLTLAELTSNEKNKISARALAIKDLEKKLQGLSK
ncbi:MAG: RdgB/HAM1 family non-canonical purine NTP pyrophosphatase [Bacilli bacterium]|nr:RdgB/HAM1 family non-canonical purine NTP pyrophosphatase [Bacilli bacterium]